MTDESPKPVEPVRLIFNNPQAVDPKPAESSAGGGRGATPEDRPRRRRHGGLPDGCPVEPLGINGDWYYYLDEGQQLRELKGEKHSRLAVQSLFGKDIGFLYDAWPRKNAEGNTTGWRPEKVAEALMGNAAGRGVWDVFGRVRGPGGWLGPDGELVFHCGDGLMIGAPPAQAEAGELKPHPLAALQPGQIGRYVYPAAASIPRPSEDVAPGGQHGAARTLLGALATWNWLRGEVDAVMLLGWIGAAILGGALTWRPLVWITGDRSTGKSTLQKLVQDVLGDAVISVSDATAAGVWQKIGHASLPVALDELEAEADNRRGQNVIKLARQAASGGLVLRGGADHGGVDFRARSCFLFSSIRVPPLQAQDQSRMAILELAKLKGAAPPTFTPGQYNEIGRALRRRLIDQWPRFAETLASYRAELMQAGHGGRGADQFGTLIACADLLLFDFPPESETLANWAANLAPDKLRETQDQAADHEVLIEYLRTQISDIYGGGQKFSIGTLIAEAAGTPRRDHETADCDGANEKLGIYGLKVWTDKKGNKVLCVANNHQGAAKLFVGSQWAGAPGATAPWVRTLRKVPGWREGNMRFNAVPSRCALIPIEQILPEIVES